MKKSIFILASAISLSLFGAGEPAWPSDFDTKVAARETVRVAATSSSATSNATRLEFYVATADWLLADSYFGTYRWWLEDVSSFALDTDARLGLYILLR